MKIKNDHWNRPPDHLDGNKVVNVADIVELIKIIRKTAK